MNNYLGRFILFNRPTSHDQNRMPQRALSPSPTPVSLPRASAPVALERLALAGHPGSSLVPLPRLLDDSGTTAFVVVTDGRIVWERFGNRGRADEPARCFSVTKSVASALVGLAVGSGSAVSVETPIGTWLPELLDSRVRELSLAHLLEMRSGIRFVEGVLPWCDEPRTYYATDLRRRLLMRTMTDVPGAFFHYNDWHPLLLTLLLERATGMPVTAWLQTKLWNPLGAESRGRVFYRWFWWGHRLDGNRYDFFAMGVLGQHVYVSPDTRTVIVRLSKRFPRGMWWAPLLRRVAEAAATQ